MEITRKPGPAGTYDWRYLKGETRGLVTHRVLCTQDTDEGEPMTYWIHEGLEEDVARHIAAAPDLAEALKFYATPHHWTRTELVNGKECDSDVEQDGGARAQEALRDAGLNA